MQALRHLMVFLMVLALATPALSHAVLSADCHEPSPATQTVITQTAVSHSETPTSGDLCCIAATCQICAPGQAMAAFEYAAPVRRSQYPISLAQVGPALSPEPAEQPPRRV